MKILESQKNGLAYQNLYLRLCLLSLKTEGALLFKDAIPYDIATLSTVLRVPIDTVKAGIEIFQKLGLVEILSNDVVYMADLQSLIGRSSTEAERVKLHRIKKKEIEGCTFVQQMTDISTPELRVKKDIREEKNSRGVQMYDKCTPSPDPLYKPIFESFIAMVGKFTNYKKEAQAIKRLIEYFKNHNADNPEMFAQAVITKYYELTQSGSNFWRGQPFTPSALSSSGIFDRVLTEMKDTRKVVTHDIPF
jgi:predicted phage replisome organizer